jgi:superfamily II RNA helicase
MNQRTAEIPPPKLIGTLQRFNLLPAIVFLPTRRKCDEAAMEVARDRSQRTDPERQRRREEVFREMAEVTPEILNHKHRKMLVQTGVASHHAGHIPAWKLVIEKMMSAGLLNAIFATSTVAAGVDFPARTVVITNADTRGNEGWRPLRASELQQMTGRAGRRGKDLVGFVVLAPGQFQNPRKIAELLKAPPDPLESQFRATYTSLLNLLDAFGSFAPVREIAEKSFASRNTRHQIDRLEKKRERTVQAIRESIDEATTGLTIDDVRGYERLSSTIERIHQSIPATRAEMRHDWLRKNVTAGRVVTKGRSGKRLFIVLNVSGEKVTAMRDDGQGAGFELSAVTRVFKRIYPLKDDAIEEAFFDVYEHRNEPLEEPKIAAGSASVDKAAEILANASENFVPDDNGTESRADLQQILIENVKHAETLQKIERDIEYLRSDIWTPFENRARVLDHFGYLDFSEQSITERGKWLADLRIDRPLLVGEALNAGLFEGMSSRQIAGFMASVAADPERSYGELRQSNPLLDLLSEFEELIFRVASIEFKFNVEPSQEINYSAAAAAERWADGWDWDDLVEATKAEEGDLFRLLARTGEALLQVANLHKSNPGASAIAREAADAILREPVR